MQAAGGLTRFKEWKSKRQIAKDLGISDSTLSKWCKEFGEQGEVAFPGKGHQTPLEEENKSLQRETRLWGKNGHLKKQQETS
jgi:transposase